MLNEKLWKALNLQVDQEELKAVIKEDIFDIKGPRIVASMSPWTPKGRLRKFLEKQENTEEPKAP